MLRAQAELVSRPLPVTSAVEEVTKAPARSFREWVREHADAFLWAPGGSRTGAVMRAARIHEFGDASVIRLDEVPIPRPGPGEVLLEVRATSFNPSEVGLRSGLLPEVFRASLPHTPRLGRLGHGRRNGRGCVSGLAPGDRVFGMADGAAAEYVVAPAGALARAPRSIPLAATPPRRRPPWPGSPHGRRSTSTPASRPGSGCWSTGPAAGWACSPYSSPSWRART
ncbi:hypothetical protein GCM10020220_113650 [Nonomuraea rubra]|uniref:alcohol dehydrogenase catalytic domain-containing protein n=1 Tax=Nonomuraea rubra TaxID=46180 RepID=UPI0031E4FC0A